MIFTHLGVTYAGENDFCEFISAPGKLKICLTIMVGIEPTTFGMLTQCFANLTSRSGLFEHVIFRCKVFDFDAKSSISMQVYDYVGSSKSRDGQGMT